MKSLFKLVWIWIVLGILLLILLILTPFPYHIKGPCLFLPQLEWSLTQVNPEKILKKSVENAYNRLHSYTLLQFNRQDFVRFSIEPKYKPGDLIKKGAIVGQISSPENRMALDNLLGELKKAKVNLKYVQTGEKSTLQQEAIENLEYSRTQVTTYEPLLKRKRKLFDEGFISKEELEISEATFQLYKQNVALQKAKLDVVLSGEKEESIQLMRAEMARLQSQINIMNNKLANEQFIAPFDGIMGTFQDSILCKISKIDTATIHMPISISKAHYIHNGQSIKVSTGDGYFSSSGTVCAIIHEVVLIQGQPMILVTGCFPNTDQKHIMGLNGWAKISIGKMSLIQQLHLIWKQYKGKM